MSEKTLVLDRTGREWAVGHWAIKYWYEFVHLVVAAVDAGWGLKGAFMLRDLSERIIGVQEHEEQLLAWAKANQNAWGLYLQPPIPVDTVDALDALCEHGIEQSACVAEWQDSLRDGVAGIKPADESPVPNMPIPASDYRPTGLVRRVAAIVRRIPGDDKPDDPGSVTTADAAKAYFERVRRWCEANGGREEKSQKKQVSQKEQASPGRPPATDEEKRRQEKQLADWEAARREKSTLKEFAKERGLNLKVLRKELAAARRRRERAKKPKNVKSSSANKPRQ